MKHIRGLDTLRTLAVGGVILAHFNYLPFGWVGVQIFFVLSGFLITGILDTGKRADRSAKEYFGIFYWRRAVRIFPLYYGYLLLLAAVYWLTSHPPGFAQSWISLFTYTTNFARTLPDYPQSHYYSLFWSLAVEEQFYLVWPAVVFVLSRQSLIRLIATLIVCAPLIRWLTGLGFEYLYRGDALAAAGAVYNVTWTHFDAFGCGAAAALGVPFFTNRPARKFFISGGLTLLAGMAMIFLGNINAFAGIRSLGWPLNMPYFHQYIWGYSLLNISAAFLIAAIARREFSSMALWENPILNYCGKISYGLYVWHDAIQAFTRKQMHLLPDKPIGLPGALVALSATFVVAALSFHLYEQPFLKLKDVFANSRRNGSDSWGKAAPALGVSNASIHGSKLA